MSNTQENAGISSKDLRVGNMVEMPPDQNYDETSSSFVEITSFTGSMCHWAAKCTLFGGVGKRCSGTRAQDLLPIPLTEDLLTRIGFEIDYSTQFVEATLGNFTMDIMAVKDSSDHIEMSRRYNKQHDVCLKYLHQLQNLFYALSGEELDVTGVK